MAIRLSRTGHSQLTASVSGATGARRVGGGGDDDDDGRSTQQQPHPRACVDDGYGSTRQARKIERRAAVRRAQIAVATRYPSARLSAVAVSRVKRALVRRRRTCESYN